MTQRLGAKLAQLVCPGDVIALSGDLGAGKTSLARGFIQHFLPEETIPSPSFTLVQYYQTPKFSIWHYDFYRLADISEIPEIGFEDSADGVALIEWPEKMGLYLPKNRLDIHIRFKGKTRSARLDAGIYWHKRIEGFEFDVS